MSLIKQEGDGNQANIGNNSIVSMDSEINITAKQKGGWFFCGFVLPIIVALITEFIKHGKVSEILSLLLNKAP